MDRNTHRALERLEIVETGRRRRWSDEEKLKIVIESMACPRLVSATARRYGISRSQLATWRRTFRDAPAGPDLVPTFVPAVLAPVSELPRQGSVATSSRMEIILTCGRRIVIDAGVDPEALARVIAVVDRRR
ncbi:IS66-like element accessory protein TnpA [Jiella pelagia]|uniref:Transposase n=2 Tax=Jiella pelagia TaxID=2986949 RepID=A0ABY7C5Q3_9HYPH|nr:transposase [Jiella pelagia]WAP70907.1 transposase [Jiella pelagia]